MKKNSKHLIFIIVFLLSVVSITLGFTFGFFTYFGEGQTNNVIKTGRIIFSYDESNALGNGVYISDAFPVSDEIGKSQANSNEYFDFTVSAFTSSSDLLYEVVALKDDESTLDDKYVKLYLTYYEGNLEKPSPYTLKDNKVLTYDELTDTSNKLLSGKSIYFDTVKAGEVAYGKKFRLRMWIGDDTLDENEFSSISSKFFKVKVNVDAVGIN